MRTSYVGPSGYPWGDVDSPSPSRSGRSRSGLDTLPAPVPPSDPRRSAEVRLLGEWLDSVAAANAPGSLDLLIALLLGQEIDLDRLQVGDRRVVGRMKSALLREQERRAGLLSETEAWLWRAGLTLSSEGREILRLPIDRAIDQLLGWHDAAGWHPGRAGLTPREQAVFRCCLQLRGEDVEGRWQLRPLAPWEIARELSRARGDRSLPPAVTTIENHLSRARQKIRRCLLARDDDGV